MFINFTRETIIQYLTELASRLAEQKITAEIFIVGGSALALAYTPQRFTADIDAWYYPSDKVYHVAEGMRKDYPQLPQGWLNDAKTWMNLNRWLPCASPVSLDVEGISVSVAKPEQLLAMKVAAARYGKDDADVKLLICMLGLTSVTQVLDVVETTYGEELARKILTPKTQFFIEETCESLF